MTQSDGRTPTPDEIRAQMRVLKPLLERLEAALTACARVPKDASIHRRFKAYAELTAVQAELRVRLAEMGVALGLPYEAVIDTSYTAVFGPDD